jgi:hypothetical protein
MVSGERRAKGVLTSNSRRIYCKIHRRLDLKGSITFNFSQLGKLNCRILEGSAIEAESASTKGEQYPAESRIEVVNIVISATVLEV